MKIERERGREREREKTKERTREETGTTIRRRRNIILVRIILIRKQTYRK